MRFVLKFALPPFSPPLPSGVQISKENMHRTFDPINNSTPVVAGLAPRDRKGERVEVSPPPLHCSYACRLCVTGGLCSGPCFGININRDCECLARPNSYPERAFIMICETPTVCGCYLQASARGVGQHLHPWVAIQSSSENRSENRSENCSENPSET